MDNMIYLFAAYTIIWLGICVLVFSLIRREKQLRREIENLKEILNHSSTFSRIDQIPSTLRTRIFKLHLGGHRSGQHAS